MWIPLTLLFIAFLVFICCQISYRIGAQQKMEWEDFKKDNPQLFKQPEEKKDIVKCPYHLNEAECPHLKII